MALPWRRLGLGAVACGLLALPAAWSLDRAFGREVLLVAAADAETVQVQRALWELDGSPKEGVPAIYGTPTREPVRVVFVPEASLLRPEEDPARTLFLRHGEEHPLQAQTLYYFGVPAAVGGVLVGIALLLVARRRRPGPR